MSQSQEQRTLTDADINAIVEKAESVIVARFYRNLGKGLWGMIWKTVLVGLIVVAAYGSMSGRH